MMISGNNTSGCELNLYDESGGQRGILGVSGTEFFIKAPNTNAPMSFYTHNGTSLAERMVLRVMVRLVCRLPLQNQTYMFMDQAT